MFALAAVLALSALPAAQPFGPPAICHPLRIGKAVSLPWGDLENLGDFDADFRLEELATRTAKLLASSDDSIFHMETIRRACLYLGSRPSSWNPSTTVADRATSQRALEVKLEVALKECLDLRKAGQPDERREALAHFDIGYLRGALGQYGLDANSDVTGPIDAALELEPKNVGMLLGASLVHFRTDRQWRYLDRAVRLAEDGGDDLRWNIVSSAGHIHGLRDFEQLAERARRETGA